MRYYVQETESSDRMVTTGKQTTLGRINDVLAMICICTVIAWNTDIGILFFAQLAFFAVTAINAIYTNRKLSAICVWAALFYGYSILSMFWAYNPESAYAYLLTMIKTAFFVIFISLYMNGMREVDVILKSIIAGAVILTIILLIYTPLSEWGDERLGAEFGMNQNDVAMTYVFGAALCLYYSRKKALFLLLFVAFAVILMFTGSRRAFLLMLFLIFVLFLTKVKRPSSLLLLIPSGFLIYAIIYLSMTNEVLYNVLGVRMEGLFNMLSGEGNVDSSALKRMYFIERGIELFLNNAITGYGINSFRYMNALSAYSHNNYIEMLVSFGLLGTLLYYSLHIAILIKSVLIWIQKSKDVLLPVLLIIIILVSDYGTVSYYSSITIIILSTAYKMVTLADQPAPEEADMAVV